jgi:hypothetical protein
MGRPKDRSILPVLFLGGMLIILIFSSYLAAEFVCLLLSGFLFFSLIVTLVRAVIAEFVRWRKFASVRPLRATVCLAFLLCALWTAPVAQYVSDWMFQRHLGDYSRVVDAFKNGDVSCASLCNGAVEVVETAIPPPHIRNVWGAHCDDGGLVVSFLVKTDVPLLHEGYLYRTYGESSDCAKGRQSREFRWPYLFYRRHIAGNWYRISDQPGF